MRFIFLWGRTKYWGVGALFVGFMGCYKFGFKDYENVHFQNYFEFHKLKLRAIPNCDNPHRVRVSFVLVQYS